MQFKTKNVGREGNQSAGNIGDGDCKRADRGAVRIGTFEAQFKPHHEIDPALLI